MNDSESAGAPLPGAIRLPDGSCVRGRGLRHGPLTGPDPTLGLYLGVSYSPTWPHHHVPRPDFWLPTEPQRTAKLLLEAHEHALRGGRVEIACTGGRGRTGTDIAAFAILSGVQPADAVEWTRQHYDPRAVETPWQRRWVRRFPRLVRTIS